MVENDLAAMPASRREVELLIAAEDVDTAKQTAIDLCAKAFSTTPVPGVVTFVSRGTDDDAHGVLSAFGLTGEIVRTPGDDGFDIVYVTLREDDLERDSGKPRPHGAGGVAQLRGPHSHRVERISEPRNSRIAGAACTQVSNMLKCFTLPAARSSDARSHASSGQGGSMSFDPLIRQLTSSDVRLG